MTNKLAVLAKPSKLPIVGNLDMYAKQVHEEYTAFKGLETEATWRALRIGALLILVKDQLPHGQFGKWASQNVPFIPQQTYNRFMNLAEAFRKDGQLGYEPIKLLSKTTDPAKPSKQGREYVKLALAFIGDKSLTDLYIEYGIIKRDIKDRGGARQNTHPQRTPDQEVEYKTELAKRMAYDAGQAFDDLCGKDLIKFLPDEAVTAVHQALANAYHAFSNEIKGRRIGKRG